jgi:hypothetical protein
VGRRACLAVVALVLLLRGPLLFKHAFDPDEFQHLHSAFCIAQGLVPYRDYFDHHTPWLHLLLAPALRLVSVEQDPERAVAAIFAARALMWALSGAIVWLTYRLGLLWRGATTGLLAAALLTLIGLFPDKTLEIRPDVPACVVLLACWVLALDGRRPLLAGACGGAALMFTPKAIFALPGALLPVAATGFGAATVFLLGALLPVLVTLLGFAAVGAAHHFVASSLLANVAWRTRFSPVPVLASLAHDNTAIIVLAGLGAALCVGRLVASRCRRDAFVAIETLALLVGGFVIPIPYAQYFVPLLPLIALLAADALESLLERIPEARRGGTLALALVLLALSPLSVAAAILRPDNARVADKLRKLRYAMNASRPGDAFLDGFSGLGAFRPHAFRFFFLHDEMRAQLSAADVAQLVNGLRDGAIAPVLVAADADLRAVSPGLWAFLQASYAPTLEPPLLKLRELWIEKGGARLELSDEPTATLVGRGWRAAEREAGVGFRRARGGFATLRLPVRSPLPRVLALRVRGAQDAGVDVLVNGTPIARLSLSPFWQEATLPIPEGRLRPGVNGVRFGMESRGDLAAVDFALAWLEAR